ILNGVGGHRSFGTTGCRMSSLIVPLLYPEIGPMFSEHSRRQSGGAPFLAVLWGEENPRQRGRQRGLGAGQYSLGKWITLLAKYRVISSSGKSVYSISLMNTMLPLPSSHESVAVRSGRTASFQT